MKDTQEYMTIDETKLEQIISGNIPDIGRTEIFVYSNSGIKNIELQFDGFENNFSEDIIKQEENWEKIRAYLDEMFCYEFYSLFLVYREKTIELERLRDSTVIFTNERITVEKN